MMEGIYFDYRYMRWILVYGLCVAGIDAYYIQGQDCRTLDKGPYYFKRVDDYTYQCVRGGPLYKCPEHWSIPVWYTYDDKDPCMCQDVVSKGHRVCPKDPLDGYRTTEDPISATPPLGTIGDNGCPSPFQKFARTLRIYNSTDARELKLSHSMGFLTAEDECKYHCLTMAACTGVTHSIQNGDPICVGFFDRVSKYDLRLSEFHVYFEKVYCSNDASPIVLAPPPIQNGLLLVNTKQGSESLLAFLTNVTELSCYAWCQFADHCAAVDYNMFTKECFYFTHTSCEAHAPALDKCCNHYKKHYVKC